MAIYDQLPGSWPHIFHAVREATGKPGTVGRAVGEDALLNLYHAVKYLIDACPDDNAVQLAARRGGQLMGDADDANSAVQMMRVAALIELLQEAQKERCTVTAYRRTQKNLQLLGFYNPHAINLTMYFLCYHADDEGKPYEWLAKKLAGKGKQ